MAKARSADSLRKAIGDTIKEERDGVKMYRALAKAVTRSFAPSKARTTITRRLMDIAKDENRHNIMLLHVKSLIKKL